MNKEAGLCKYSRRGRWGCIPTNKKPGYYKQMNKEAAVANLSRSSLCRGTAFRSKTLRGEREMVGIFHTYCQHLHMDQRKGLLPL